MNNALTELRTQLFLNGWRVLPDKGKSCLYKGWNRYDYISKELSEARIASWTRRFPDYLNTGVRIEGGLCVIDVDVDDQLAEKIFREIERIAPEVAARAPMRYGHSPHKFALFTRLVLKPGDEPFSRLPSARYYTPAEAALKARDPDQEIKGHQIEVFGGRPTAEGHCSKQIALYGPHPDGGEYTWTDGPQLTEARCEDLPAIGVFEIGAILDAYHALAEAAEWVLVEKQVTSHSDAIYDITDTSQFDVQGGGTLSYAELAAGQRCSSSFFDPFSGGNRSKCHVLESGRHAGSIAVFDYKTLSTHYHERYKPVDTESFGIKLVDVLGIEPPRPARTFTVDDFEAYLPDHTYVYMATREFWPATSVNSLVRPVQLFDDKGTAVTKTVGRGEKAEEKPVFQAAGLWLDKNKPLEQQTWAPGEPDIIRDRLMADGGWMPKPRSRVLNLYRPAPAWRGDATAAGPWVDHVRMLYGAEADHILRWLAHRVQRPQQKINHALVLGGRPGIGKDTILEPVKMAIGHWNMAEIAPKQLLENFNEYAQSVILRISEVRDLGEMTMLEFYNCTKIYCAAPPDVIRVNRKHLGAYYIPNVTCVVMTTNYRINCLYLTLDDRRHFVAWSDIKPEDLGEDYLEGLWSWYEAGGYGHVAAYLAGLDLSSFAHAAPPRKTQAFLDIVEASTAPEDSDLAEILAGLDNPAAVTIDEICMKADPDFRSFLLDRKNRRAIPHRFEQCGYTAVRNTTVVNGVWTMAGRKQTVYAKADLSIRDRLIAAGALKVKLDAEKVARDEMVKSLQPQTHANGKKIPKTRL